MRGDGDILYACSLESISILMVRDRMLLVLSSRAIKLYRIHGITTLKIRCIHNIIFLRLVDEQTLTVIASNNNLRNNIFLSFCFLFGAYSSYL